MRTSLSYKISGAFSRFTAAFIFIGILLVFSAVAYAVDIPCLYKRKEIILFYFANASFLSAALCLWKEENSRLSLFARILIQLILLCIFIMIAARPGDFSAVSVASVTFCTFFCYLAASFQRETDDIKFVNFTLRMAVTAAASLIVSFVFMIALFLINESLELFFELHVKEYIFTMETVFSYGVLFPALVFLFTPTGELKHNTSTDIGRFPTSVIRYILTPLLAVYIFILYIYLLKIIFTWTLPDGMVATMVSISAIGSMLLIILLYPSKGSESDKPADAFLRKWLPVLLLPPLVLMSVGIFRRISDYGITVHRLYIAMFNLWFYAVCITLIVTKGKRIWWIPASLAVILLFSSVGPANLNDTSRRALTVKARNLMTQNGASAFPLDSASYCSLLNSADSATADKISQTLDYLDRYYPESVKALTDSTVNNFYMHEDFASISDKPATREIYLSPDNLQMQAEDCGDSVILTIIPPEDCSAGDIIQVSVPKDAIKDLCRSSE